MAALGSNTSLEDVDLAGNLIGKQETMKVMMRGGQNLWWGGGDIVLIFVIGNQDSTFKYLRHVSSGRVNDSTLTSWQIMHI